jgi:hypothetical protein
MFGFINYSIGIKHIYQFSGGGKLIGFFLYLDTKIRQFMLDCNLRSVFTISSFTILHNMWKIRIIFHLMIITAGGIECAAQVNGQPNADIQLQYINGSAEFQKTIMFENITAADLYNALNQWTISSFNSSAEVIKHTIENELIQIEGIEPGIVLFKFPRSTAQLKYILNMEIENNKLCFTMLKMEVLTELNKYTLEEYNFEKNGRELVNKQTKRVKDHATRIASVLINSLNTFFVENGIDRKWD